MLSAEVTSFINIRLIVRLTGVVPMVMVGVLVALLAKGDPEPQTPAILLLTDTMSLELELEKRGESVMVWLEGLLAL